MNDPPTLLPQLRGRTAIPTTPWTRPPAARHSSVRRVEPFAEIALELGALWANMEEQ